MPTFNAQQLAAALPSLAALSDADVAAQPGWSAPILVAKQATVTITTLASIWGKEAAATFLAQLRGGIAAGQAQGASIQTQQFAAEADLALTVLSGPGLSPGDPVSQSAAEMFVNASIATQDQVNGVFYDAVYMLGGPVLAADVTAARAALALSAQYLPLRVLLANLSDALMTEERAGTPAPSVADLGARLGAM